MSGLDVSDPIAESALTAAERLQLTDLEGIIATGRVAAADPAEGDS